jgi:hypothetical protein
MAVSLFHTFPSNLMEKTNGGLKLPIFETFIEIYCHFLNFWLKIEKLLKLSRVKTEYSPYIYIMSMMFNFFYFLFLKM